MSSKITQLLEKKVVHPLQELSSFFRQYLVMPNVIGALTPSSSYVASAVAEPLKTDSSQPRRILEIGAGTGVISKVLLQHLKPGDRLYLIECVPELVVELREVISQSNKQEQVTLFEGYFQDFHAAEKFDFVISGLPLISFAPDLVESFYKQLDQGLLKEDATFSYYEYLWIPQVRLGIQRLCKKFWPLQYENTSRVVGSKRRYLTSKSISAKKIWRNFTPMRVVHVHR